MHRNDVITGGENSENHLQVTMKGSFNTGFDGVKQATGEITPALVNIDQVDLINPTNSQLVFNAANAGSIPTWNLVNTNTRGELSLSNLVNPGLTVNLQGQAQGSAQILFTTTAVAGANDSITIGLDNVGRIATSKQAEQAVNLVTDDVENIILSSTGPIQNIVNLSRMADSANVTIQGNQQIKITDLAGTVKTVNGQEATGDLSIDGSSATLMTSLTLGAGNDTFTTVTNPNTPAYAETASLKTIDMGAGNDTLDVKSINSLATVHGGEGADVLAFHTSGAASYRLTMDGVETLTVDSNAGAMTFDGTYMQDVATLNVKNAGAAVVLDRYNADNLTVNITDSTGTNANAVTANGVDNVDFNLGTAAKGLTYSGALTANDATTVTLDLSTNGGSGFTGTIIAPSAQVLNIDTFAGAIVGQASGSVKPAGGDNLVNVSNLNTTGNGNVNIIEANNIGALAPEIRVDASGAAGSFQAVFSGNVDKTDAVQTLHLEGSATKMTQVKINSTYDNITINTGTASDVIDLSAFTVDQLKTMVSNNAFYINLGDGQDTIHAKDAPAVAYLQELSKEGVNIVGVETIDTTALGWSFATSPLPSA